jgi:hypothetical protein
LLNIGDFKGEIEKRTIKNEILKEHFSSKKTVIDKMNDFKNDKTQIDFYKFLIKGEISTEHSVQQAVYNIACI